MRLGENEMSPLCYIEEALDLHDFTLRARIVIGFGKRSGAQTLRFGRLL